MQDSLKVTHINRSRQPHNLGQFNITTDGGPNSIKILDIKFHGVFNMKLHWLLNGRGFQLKTDHSPQSPNFIEYLGENIIFEVVAYRDWRQLRSGEMRC